MNQKPLVGGMSIISIGILLIVIGFMVVLIGTFMQSFNEGKGKSTDSKISFVGFIGPIPFGFGNDKQWVMASLVIAAIIFFFFTLFFKGVR